MCKMAIFWNILVQQILTNIVIRSLQCRVSLILYMEDSWALCIVYKHKIRNLMMENVQRSQNIVITLQLKINFIQCECHIYISKAI